jgi:hypothetical protein
MTRRGSLFLLSLGILLLAGCAIEEDEAPAAGPPAPAGFHPYLYHENQVIDGPSVFWLVAVSPSQPVTKALWCDSGDPADEIVRIDGEAVQFMTGEQIAGYFAGAHGWPVHLLVKPESGPARELDCYGHR